MHDGVSFQYIKGMSRADSTNLPAAGPVRSLRLGTYRLSIAPTTRFGRYRWEAERKGRGVGGHLTPFGALWHCRRWSNTRQEQLDAYFRESQESRTMQ